MCVWDCKVLLFSVFNFYLCNSGDSRIKFLSFRPVSDEISLTLHCTDSVPKLEET